MKTPDGAYEVQMQNTVLDAMRNQLTVGGKYAVDTKGKEIYSGMQSSFYALWDSEIKAGKTPAQLADPESKDYIGNAFMSLKRSPSQALADVANAKPEAGDGEDYLTQLTKNAVTVSSKEERDKLAPGTAYYLNGKLFQKGK